MNEGGMVAVLTEVAKILGLIVVGSMCASMVTITTPFVFKLKWNKKLFYKIFFDGIIKRFLTIRIYIYYLCIIRKRNEKYYIIMGNLNPWYCIIFLWYFYNETNMYDYICETPDVLTYIINNRKEIVQEICK